jgi:hypothetical protein
MLTNYFPNFCSVRRRPTPATVRDLRKLHSSKEPFLLRNAPAYTFATNSLSIIGSVRMLNVLQLSRMPAAMPLVVHVRSCPNFRNGTKAANFVECRAALHLELTA